MTRRDAVLTAALAFIALLVFLTIHVSVREGVDVLTVFALVVLAMFAFGIVGALRDRPPED